MTTKVIIPTSYGSPSATFSINGNNYVLPTGVETTVPDEVALLISQHEAQKEREEPARYLPDVVDVVFTFDSFSGTTEFTGTSNKSLADIFKEVGDRGADVINLKIKNQDALGIPFRIRKTDSALIVCWIGLRNEDGIRVYKGTLSLQSKLIVTGEPMMTIMGDTL